MESFDVRNFCRNPARVLLMSPNVTRQDLTIMASYFKLDYDPFWSTDQFRNFILKELDSQGVLIDQASTSIDPHSPVMSTLSASSSNNDNSTWTPERFEFEKLKQEQQERLELRKLELQAEQQKIEKQKLEQQERLEMIEKEKLEEQKLQREQQERLEKQKLEQQERLEMMKIELSNRAEERALNPQFNICSALPLVPDFDEEDPDGYFRKFETAAHHHKWPRDQWTWLVSPKFKGKAAITYNSLDNLEDYQFVKNSILDAYAITPDGYRQKFRTYYKSNSETYVEFATEKLRRLRKWLDSTQTNTYDKLVNLIALEEFKRKIPSPILMRLEDRGEEDLIRSAQWADKYSLTYKTCSANHRPSNNSNTKPPGNKTSGLPGGKQNETHSCSYCKQKGHTIANCPDPKCKKALSSSRSNNPDNAKPVVAYSLPDSPKDVFQDFKFKGTVALSNHSPRYEITILRDTAAAQSVIYKKSLPGIDRNYTGEKVILKDFSAHPVLHLAKIHLQTELVSGIVQVGVRESELPVQGVQFLLGNDLAGKLIVPNLTVVDRPLEESPTKDLDSHEHLFPLCAVTRSQRKKRRTEPPPTSPLENLPSPLLSKSDLIQAQQSDPSLSPFFRNAADRDQTQKVPCFYIHEGILMRVYRPSNISSSETWSETHQIVVPQSLRQAILELAHDGVAGHLGINKTYRRTLAHYYWPGIKADVTTYVKSCHTCQLAGKPNQVIPPAPLNPIPIVSEPFERVIIDTVGPLPKTRRGNQYLLTIMCASTRYPEAYPLKRIDAKTITRCLLHLFSSVGIPKTLQCDRASSFTSELMTQVLGMLNINQRLSSAYHPQSQGCLERFHQTFKSMLRKYCVETEQDWDENVSLLLFALRECPQESLGYSPFELLYGRQVRGPLKVLKDEWLSQNSPHSHFTVKHYVQDLKDKLSKIRKLAIINLEKNQSKMKYLYDRKAQCRNFHPGDKVLLFLPIPGNPLKSKYTGPYLVQQKLSNLNYVVSTPDRRKETQLVHVNLMKPYVDRSLSGDSDVDATTESHSDIGLSSVMCIGRDQVEPDLEIVDVSSTQANPPNSQVLNNMDSHLPSLSHKEKTDLKLLLAQFPTTTRDLPGFCTLILHDVELTQNATPIRQAPFRLNPEKKLIMKREINFLLENDLARPSNSPWASPCILTPKPDGSFRFCTDYRKVNQLTVPDAYPLPLIDDLIDMVGQSRIISKVDLQKGYYQVGLTERAKTISAFITPFGLFEYQRMPFGMRNAPATFQRTINSIIHGLDNTYSYLDDLLIISDTWSEHLKNLEDLFTRLATAGLTINLAKSSFGNATITYLGHVVGKGQTKPKHANVEAIINFPTPTSRKSLMRFLGTAGFYRRFCPNFASIAAPLTDLTSPKTTFKWTPVCEAAFHQLKTLLSSNPVLQTPNFSHPFILQIDASSSGVGAVLLQQDQGTKVLHPVAYHSAKLKPHQRSYSTIELEALSLVSALKKFEYYLVPQQHAISVYTDHNPLVFLHRMQHTNQRLLRWSLQVQRYHLDIRHIKGVDNIIADTLSRDPSD